MASETNRSAGAFKLESSPRCPSCDALLDGATSLVREASPCAGDLTVCMYCGAALEFTQGLGLRMLKPAELAALDAETKRDFLRVYHEMSRRPRRPPPRGR